MKNPRLATLLILFVVCIACQSPDPAPDEVPTPQPSPGFAGAAFEFQQVREDVYQARGTGNVSVGSNAAIVLNEDDVLVVDSHISPVAATALISELQSITDKPVRCVVNTHFHFDHAHGNQIYELLAADGGSDG